MPNLTSQQQAAVDAALRGESCSVQSVAGSGKTSGVIKPTLSDWKRGSTLAVAFNVSTKKDLEKAVSKDVTVKTLNGLGHAAWGGQLGKRLTLNADKLYDMANEILKDQEFDHRMNAMRLAKGARKALVPPSRKFNPRYKGDIEQAWEHLRLEEDLTHAEMADAQRLLGISVQEGWNGLIDFDDQIYMPLLYGGRWKQYDHVFIDEAQDLSPANHKMIEACRPKQVVAVGDPNQSIYGFRGADTESMTKLLHKFDQEIYRLSVSFRCPENIVKLARQFVPDMEAFKEGGTVIEGEGPLPLTAHVLCRTNAPLFSLAFNLLSNNRPAQLMGVGSDRMLINFVNKCAPDGDRTPMEIVMDNAKARVVINEKLHDRMVCVERIYEASAAPTAGDLNAHIKKLFSADGITTLSSVHKAKGLEWTHVTWLNPYSTPGKGLVGEDLQQEYNNMYVAITRALDTIHLVPEGGLILE